MSHLLNSGLVGITDKERSSLNDVYYRWRQTGFLDGLDKDVAIKVSIAFEITALILLLDNKMCDMYYKMTEENAFEEPEYETMIFPIVRRVISGFNEAHEYVTEILGMAKSSFNSMLWKSLRLEKESAIVYFYDVILPNSGDEWHLTRRHKTYYDLKKDSYQRHLSRGGNKGYEEYMPIDVQAEYCAYLARKIENKLREKYEKVN